MTSNETLVLTGMSGAGRSTVAHALEDLGWYVVDNLPPALLPALVGKGTGSQGKEYAVVVDVRGGHFFDELTAALAELKKNGSTYRLVFLDATDQALVQRFESTRRPHPLQGGDRIVDGIARERAKLEEVRAECDIAIDTTNLNVHQLEKRIGEIFGGGKIQGIRINVLSFGYKYGIPYDADFILDCRFIPNPHWVPELQPLSGKDGAVAKMVLDNPATKDFINNFLHLFDGTKDGFLQEGKRYLTIAIGCTGGRHRSVAVSEFLANEFKNQKIDTTLNHRDLDR